MDSSWMWCALVSMLLVPVVGVYAQQDTDGDGLLDAVDVNGFIRQQGTVRMNERGLEDLDGLSQVPNLPSLDSITGLDLSGNSITSIEAGDFFRIRQAAGTLVRPKSNHQHRKRRSRRARKSSKSRH